MNGSHDVWLAVGVGTVISVIAIALYSLWSARRGHEAISRWANEHKLQVVLAVRCSFVPHWGSTSGRGYQFFRLRVRDQQEQVREGWVRCSDLGRTDAASVEVIWDVK